MTQKYSVTKVRGVEIVRKKFKLFNISEAIWFFNGKLFSTSAVACLRELILIFCEQNNTPITFSQIYFFGLLAQIKKKKHPLPVLFYETLLTDFCS